MLVWNSIFTDTEKWRKSFKRCTWLGLMIGIICYERGIPCKILSLAKVEYVPALCTHRPSLLPIEYIGEILGWMSSNIWSEWI